MQCMLWAGNHNNEDKGPVYGQGEPKQKRSRTDTRTDGEYTGVERPKFYIHQKIITFKK